MKTVAVIFGGRSAEHDVSIITAISSIIAPLELTRKYKVEPIYIAKDGSWHWSDKLKDIKLFTSGRINEFLRKDIPVSVTLDGGMTLSKKRKTKTIDIAFPSMHGTYGEDGDLAGLLDLAGVPYVGCGIAASSIAMDKVLCKQLAVANNVPVSKFVTFTRAQALANPTVKLKYPLFVKPAHLGSSIGISRVKTAQELTNALEVAAHYDDKIIVEEAVNNLVEVTLPIMGNAEPVPAQLEQPAEKDAEFFDFETKYMQGGKKGKSAGASAKGAQGYSKIPAELPAALSKEAIKVGLSVYEMLGASGIARVDMLVDIKAKKVYFNEVNPLPGGLYSHNWQQSGISNIELVERLIGYAIERQTERDNLATTFDTSYLKQF